MDNTVEKECYQIGGWFLGPKLENLNVFSDLATASFFENAAFRQQAFPTDPLSITSEIKDSESYKRQVRHLQNCFDSLCKEMKSSTNFASCRWQALANSDTALPAALGYVAALLYDCNNCSSIGGPATSQMEREAGNQLCDMLGYDLQGDITPRAYITAGGTTANIESILALMYAKFYPIAVKTALEENTPNQTIVIQELEIIFNDEPRKSAWQLMNLDIDYILDIPGYIHRMDNGKQTLDMIESYSVRRLGLCQFMKMTGLSELPIVICSSLCHYSAGKAMSIIGLGDSNLVKIPVDENGRMIVADLKSQLQKCLQQQIPVISVIATIGTTETGSIDPIDDIVKLQKEFKKKGLFFSIHADAASGGYFASILKETNTTSKNCHCPNDSLNCDTVSEYLKVQLQALRLSDAIAVDPHKTGFAPYPAGALCCKNEALIGFITFSAPYITPNSHQNNGMTGILGSKPGASVASVVLAHRVIGLHRNGYGRILQQCIMTSKMLYCKWLTLAKDDDCFICMPLKPLPKGMTLQFAKKFIQENINGKSLKEIMRNEEALIFLNAVGSDTYINAFAFNFKVENEMNHKLDLCNQLNLEIFNSLSHVVSKPDYVNRKPLNLAHTTLDEGVCGIALTLLKEYLQIFEKGRFDVLINTAMNPWIIHTNRIEILGEALRETVINSIGLITEEPEFHRFVAVGSVKNNSVFCEYFDASLDKANHQYQVIIQLKFCNELESALFEQKQKEQLGKSLSERKPILIQNASKRVLGKFVSTGTDVPCIVNCYIGEEVNDPFLSNIQILIDDVPYFKHLKEKHKYDPTSPDYLLYGDKERVHLTHKISQRSNCIQIFSLALPCDISETLVKWGLDVSVSEHFNGDNNNMNSFNKPIASTIQYNGVNGVSCTTDVEFKEILYTCKEQN